MNIYEARNVSALARFETYWENANPYDDFCPKCHGIDDEQVDCKRCNPEDKDE